MKLGMEWAGVGISILEFRYLFYCPALWATKHGIFFGGTMFFLTYCIYSVHPISGPFW